MPTGDGRSLGEKLKAAVPVAGGSIGNGRSWREILGMNARTLMVNKENSPLAMRFVDNKQRTKDALSEVGIPVPPTIELVRDRRELANLDWDSLPDVWVLKPNMGRQGAGILIASGRDDEAGDGWRTYSGRRLTRSDLVDHMRSVLDGEFSLDEIEHDRVLFEKQITSHDALAELVPQGLPDIRMVCYHSEPLLAMMRLPTNASDGKANLHQGALGAAVDLKSGRVTRALFKGEETSEHPDTGHALTDNVEVPYWDEILRAASSCSEATGLGYLGVDVVVDKELGPLVMEVNARPGLQAQNVTGVGLAARLQEVNGQS